jgi:hypothetical protein
VALIQLLSKGGPGYSLYTAYSGAVLIAGGSGISYVMGVLDDMLRNHASGNSHLRFIEVIWSISDPGKRTNPRNHPFCRFLDPLELTGTMDQIRSTLCFPSSPRSCGRARHIIALSPSGSTYIGPESPLTTRRAYRTRRFRRECTSNQDARTFLAHCKA